MARPTISQLCGSIAPEVWPGVEQLELYTKMELPKGQKRKVKERLKHYVKDAYACDLIDKLLWLDPSKRIDSDGALDHEFLWTDPLPCSLVSHAFLCYFEKLSLSKVFDNFFSNHPWNGKQIRYHLITNKVLENVQKLRLHKEGGRGSKISKICKRSLCTSPYDLNLA